MLRTFFPIGQGNFAAEQFDDGTNIVFDCGSSSGLANVEQQIKDAFQPNEEIEKVFVSHLDDDHVNGLKYLLSYCRVREVYLPFLNNQECALTRLFCLLENEREPSPFILDLLLNPEAAVQAVDQENDRQKPEVFIVYPQDSEADYRNDRNGILSGQLIPSLSPKPQEWFFIPYNFENRNRKDQFFELLEDNGYNINTLLDEIKTSKFWRQNYKRLKDIYKKIPGGLNTNSMVVYSGLKDEIKLRQRICKKSQNPYCICDCCCPIDYPEGCLYTGDYNAAGIGEWAQLTDAFKNVWQHIGTVQVPHHGSGYSYQPELSKMLVRLVINAGYQNRYRHPHASVLKDLIENEASFYWVNEHVGSGVRFVIS